MTAYLSASQNVVSDMRMRGDVQQARDLETMRDRQRDRDRQERQDHMSNTMQTFQLSLMKDMVKPAGIPNCVLLKFS